MEFANEIFVQIQLENWMRADRIYGKGKYKTIKTEMFISSIMKCTALTLQCRR